jgi:hypothetical protein
VAQRRNIFLPIFLALVCWLVTSCSSSSNPNKGTGTGSTLQISPSTATNIELTASGTVSLTVTANESNVTWSVQNPAGNAPLFGVSVSPATGNSTTFTYTTTYQPCSGGLPTIQVEVVATAAATATTSQQTAILPINIAVSPPCTAPPTAISAGGQNYTTTCPPAGTVIPPTNKGLEGQVGVYTQTPTISLSEFQPGAPYGVPPFTWSLTGSLPSGLSWSTSTDTTSVTLVGTPTAAGCSQFQFQVTDATGAESCPQPTGTVTTCQPGPSPFVFLVLPSGLSLQLPVLPLSYDGTPYPPISVEVSGGIPPYTWSENTGFTLPPGLSLTPTGNGAFVGISGTPNVGDSQTTNGGGSGGTLGSYPTSIQVNDSQSPYPAIATAVLSSMFDSVLPPACSSSAQSLSITPSTLNGGVGLVDDVSAANYLQGPFAFMLRGFDGKQPTVIAGSVTLNSTNGTVSGEEDVTQGATSIQAVPVTGTYSVGILASAIGTTTSYNRGCMTLTPTPPATGPSLTFDFSLGGCTNNYTEGGVLATSDNACGMSQNAQGENQAAGVFTTGRLMLADDGTGHSAQMSGILRTQNASAIGGGLSGPYAFGLGGWDASGGHYAMAGSMQASAGNLTSIAADINDAGTLGTQLTGGSGTLAAADTNGRIAATLSVGQANLNLAMYMISASDAFVVTTGPLSTSEPLLSGEALTTAPSFSLTSSLENTHMLAMGGLAGPGPDVSIGLLSFNAGVLSGTIYQDQAGTLATTSPVSATYSTDPSTGRTPFTTPQPGQNLGEHAFVAYLIPPSTGLTHTNCIYESACVTGFVVGSNNSAGNPDTTAQDGVLEFQISTYGPPPPFTNRYVAGDFIYGTAENLDSTSASFEGDVFATPSATNQTGGSFGNNGLNDEAFYQDSSYCLPSACPLFIPAETLTGSYTINTTGIGTFGGGAIVSLNNGNVTFYVDESPVNAHPSIVVAEQ